MAKFKITWAGGHGVEYLDNVRDTMDVQADASLIIFYRPNEKFPTDTPKASEVAFVAAIRDLRSIERMVEG